MTCGDFFSYKRAEDNNNGVAYKWQEPLKRFHSHLLNVILLLLCPVQNRTDYRQLFEDFCSATADCRGYAFMESEAYFIRSSDVGETFTTDFGLFSKYEGYYGLYLVKKQITNAMENNNALCVDGQCNQNTCCQVNTEINTCPADSDCSAIDLTGEPCTNCNSNDCCGSNLCADVTCLAGEMYTSARLVYDDDSSVCCTDVPTCSSSGICGSRSVIDGRDTLLDPYEKYAEANIAYCCPCPAGQYFDEYYSQCKQCNTNHPYGETVTISSISWRKWDQDSPAASFGSDSCVACPSGEFRWVRNSDYQNNNNVETTRCHPCNPNQVYHNGYCQDSCPNNFFAAEDRRSCNACPAEKPISTNGLTCEACPPGQYPDGTTCQECAQHTFLDTADTTDSQYGTCTNCPEGKHRYSGTVCTNRILF